MFRTQCVTRSSSNATCRQTSNKLATCVRKPFPSRTPDKFFMAPFARAAARLGKLGASLVSYISSSPTPSSDFSDGVAFISSWTYRSTLYVAPGQLDRRAGPTYFAFTEPMTVTTLLAYLAGSSLMIEALGDASVNVGASKTNLKMLYLTQYPATWLRGCGPRSFSNCFVSHEEGVTVELKWRATKTYVSASACSGADAAPLPDAVSDDVHDHLAAMLEEVLDFDDGGDEMATIYGEESVEAAGGDDVFCDAHDDEAVAE